MSHSSHDYSRCLTASTVVTEDLDDAVLEGIVAENDLLKVVRADILGKQIWLKLLALIVMHDGIPFLISSIQETFNGCLQFCRLVMHWHKHNVLCKWIRGCRFSLLCWHLRWLQEVLSLFDRVNRDTVCWINYSDQR